MSGYWQVEVSDKDWRKTAFCTQEGLSPAPDGHSLAEAKWSACLVYLDDIVIVSMTFHLHLANVRDVLDKLRQAGLRLKPGKRAFLLAKVNYLGYIVSEREVATNHVKTEKAAT